MLIIVDNSLPLWHLGPKGSPTPLPMNIFPSSEKISILHCYCKFLTFYWIIRLILSIFTVLECLLYYCMHSGVNLGICHQLWQGGAGLNRGGVKYFGELNGAVHFSRFTGGAVKTIWIILPQICMPILWYNGTMGRVHEIFFTHLRWEQQKITVYLRGAVKTFTITKHFNPQPTKL